MEKFTYINAVLYKVAFVFHYLTGQFFFFSDTQVSFDESYYLTSAADHWPIGTRFTSFEILGQDYKENVTFSWIVESPYIYLNESYSKKNSVPYGEP